VTKRAPGRDAYQHTAHFHSATDYGQRTNRTCAGSTRRPRPINGNAAREQSTGRFRLRAMGRLISDDLVD